MKWVVSIWMIVVSVFSFAQTTQANKFLKHEVKPGETIFGIATRTYKITPDQLLKANPQLKTNSLSAGQIINIPLPSAEAPSPVPEIKTTSNESGNKSIKSIEYSSELRTPEQVPTENNQRLSGPPARNNETIHKKQTEEDRNIPAAQKNEPLMESETAIPNAEPAHKQILTDNLIGGSEKSENEIGTQQTISEETYKDTSDESSVTIKEIQKESEEKTTTETISRKSEVIPVRKKRKRKPAAIYDPHFNGREARNFPSRLGEGFEKGELNLINLHAFVSNTSISYAAVRDMLFAETITDAQAAKIVGQMRVRNNLFVGVEFQSINIAFKVFRKVKKTKRELFSLELGHRERVTANLQYHRNLFKTVLQGNKQFSGKEIPLGPVRANALYVREFPVGVAMPINIQKSSYALQIRPALRGKFLMGIGNVYTRRTNATMYTDPEGKYIDFKYDYLINTSIPNSLNGLSGAGNLGWGVDAGVGFNINYNWSFDIGLIDVGSVRFTRNTNNYSRTGNFRYEGVDFKLFGNEEEGEGAGFSINEEIFDPVKTKEPYSTPLGSKITFRAEYRIGKGKWGVRRDSTRRYFQHHLSFTYIQGLQNAYNATTTPAFSLGYMYSLKNILNLGVNMGFLGYNKFSIGPYLSVKAGVFVIGFGSDNLLPFIAPKAGTGADAYFNLGFNF